jgi:hypothetical protein
MTSIIKVDTIQDQSGNNIINESSDTITIGASGDTVTIPSGATLDASGATLTLPTTIEVDTIEPQSGTSLTIGASGDTITIPSGATITNSGTATGFGGGKVLQVVQLSNSTGTTTTSTSYVTTPFAQAITPSLSSSKILCLFKTSAEINTANRYIIIKLDRDGTNLLENRFESSGTGTTSLGFNYLDSPATTSSVTYTVYFKTNNSDNLVVVNRGDELGSLILIEIGA